MLESTSGSIFDDIDIKISSDPSMEDTMALWTDIRTAFDEGGPTAVKAVIEDRVRQSRLAGEKDLRLVRSATKSVIPKKKAPAKKAPDRKRTTS